MTPCTKARTPRVSQLTMKVNIISVAQVVSCPMRGQKRKWDKNPPKNKGIIAKKKL
jgi:hypothetical protein